MAESQRSVRLFIAIPLSEGIRDRLSVFQEKLKKAVPNEKVSWVLPFNIHLTLKFLGETENSKIDKVKKKMFDAAKNISGFTVQIKNCGVFPDPKRPRVIWVGCIDNTGNLAEISKRLNSSLRSIGFEKEKKSFNPHLTIGRIRYLKDRPGSLEYIISEDVDFDRMQVKEIRLIKSRLLSSGAEYETLDRVLL
ncbi:RNA 2',3'-cyclic phosphodiesterase [Elusimicrobiota bacterium]